VSKSTKSRQRNKPKRPDGFPLFPHDSGRWAKKVNGRLHYFGRWAHRQNGELVPVDDPDASASAALERFNQEWPYLKDGRTPPPTDSDYVTLAELCDRFLSAKKDALEADELSARSFTDYYNTCKLLVGHLGKTRRVDDLRPDDFASLRKAMAEHWSASTLKNEINRCRVVLKWAYDQRLIDRPVHYGSSFNRPSAKLLRRARNEAGPKMFSPEECRRILDVLQHGTSIDTGGKTVTVKPDLQLHAMVLLGLNAAFGNTDVARLPQSAVDLENGWVSFPRPKTEIQRRIPLWPQTVSALREALANRPKPKNKADDRLCFLTVQGHPWVRTEPKQSAVEHEKDVLYVRRDSVTGHFGRLLKQLGINGRQRLGFYTLRHVFQTVAGDSRDPDAVAAIMGHVDSTMGAVYREQIPDERLRAVTETVHRRLWPE